MPPKIDALMIRRPGLIEAMYQLGVVGRDVPVLGTIADPEEVRGMVLCGPVPPGFARFAKCVAEPIIPVSEHERSTAELTVEERIRRYQGLEWFRVEDLGAPEEPADILATRHESLIEYIRQAGLAKPNAPVVPHAQREHVAGKHAIGIMPLRIGVAAWCVTNVPTSTPTSRQWEGLSGVDEQIRYLAGDVFSYRVDRLPAFPELLNACTARATPRDSTGSPRAVPIPRKGKAVSRKEIALPRAGLLVVGWDRPLATFFAQVFKPGTTDICLDDMCYSDEHTHRDCRDDLVDPWFGCEYAELPTLEDLERALGDLAGYLDEATKAELLEAQRTEGRR